MDYNGGTTMTRENANKGYLICHEIDQIEQVIQRLETDIPRTQAGGYIYIPYDLYLIEKVLEIYKNRRNQLEKELDEL